MFARHLTPPYYAVIFSSRLADDRGYPAMAERLAEIALSQPGYLGIESARDQDGFGITVSYWESEDAIAAWKQQTDHAVAQGLGIDRFYEHYELRVARINRAYDGPQGRSIE